MATLCFGLMILFLAAHELDALKRHEWRMLPLIGSLPDKTGKQVFIWAHIPLALLILWVVFQGAASSAAIALSAFAVLHVFLHLLFRGHPANEFNSAFSWSVIVGAGVFGAAHIALVL